MVLDDPTVEAAVLETARGGIVRRGLGYDRADVAVVTNIAADHLGDDGIDDLDELIHVKALVAEEICDGGSVVLNADDPPTAALADRPAVRAHAPVIRMFSLDRGNPVLAQHKAAGGVCYAVLDGQLTEIEGRRATLDCRRGGPAGRVRGPGWTRRGQRARRSGRMPGGGHQREGHRTWPFVVRAGRRTTRAGPACSAPGPAR